MGQKTYFNWSSGKDASMALYKMQQDDRFDLELLLSSVNHFHDRVSMHGLRRELLMKQVESIGLPLKTIELPEQPSMEDYNSILTSTIKELKEENYEACGFGDIFLEDLKKYRIGQLVPHGIQAYFPLWKRDTKELIHEFVDLGFKAKLICTNADLLDESFIGRDIDLDFLKDLPSNVDPCGENGEFHTFCYDGPIFKHAIKFKEGEKVKRTYPSPITNSKETSFWFYDILI